MYWKVEEFILVKIFLGERVLGLGDGVGIYVYIC